MNTQSRMFTHGIVRIRFGRIKKNITTSSDIASIVLHRLTCVSKKGRVFNWSPAASAGFQSLLRINKQFALFTVYSDPRKGDQQATPNQRFVVLEMGPTNNHILF